MSRLCLGENRAISEGKQRKHAGDTREHDFCGETSELLREKQPTPVYRVELDLMHECIHSALVGQIRGDGV